MDINLLSEPRSIDNEDSDGAPNDITDREVTLSRIASLNGHYEHWILAYANGINVVAFPDNCSALNIISEDFAKQNGFTIDCTKLTTIRLPNRYSILRRVRQVGVPISRQSSLMSYLLSCPAVFATWSSAAISCNS